MKKALNIAKNIVVWIIVVLAVLMMIFTIVSATTFGRNDRSIFGYRMYIVQTDSMSKTDFSAGDLIFVKKLSDPSVLKVDDIVTYMSQNSENFGETVTHKIRRLTTDAQGNPGFITYGTTTDTDDETVVTYPYVLGRYEGHIAGAGHFFEFLKSPQGYIVCIFVPFMILIIYQGINCISLFRRYKGEQVAALQAEKDEIAAERAETEKMKAEIEALKAQLQSQAPEQAAGEETAEEAPAPADTEE